jgi:hypothetical protein
MRVLAVSHPTKAALSCRRHCWGWKAGCLLGCDFSQMPVASQHAVEQALPLFYKASLLTQAGRACAGRNDCHADTVFQDNWRACDQSSCHIDGFATGCSMCRKLRVLRWHVTKGINMALIMFLSSWFRFAITRRNVSGHTNKILTESAGCPRMVPWEF